MNKTDFFLQLNDQHDLSKEFLLVLYELYDKLPDTNLIERIVMSRQGKVRRFEVNELAIVKETGYVGCIVHIFESYNTKGNIDPNQPAFYEVYFKNLEGRGCKVMVDNSQIGKISSRYTETSEPIIYKPTNQVAEVIAIHPEGKRLVRFENGAEMEVSVTDLHFPKAS